MNKINNIGSIIRYHRRKAGLTKKQLATLAGVGKSAIFNIEKGKISIRLNTLTAILSVLNINLELESPLMEQWNMEKQLP